MADETTTINLDLLTESVRSGAGNLKALSGALQEATRRLSDMTDAQARLRLAGNAAGLALYEQAKAVQRLKEAHGQAIQAEDDAEKKRRAIISEGLAGYQALYSGLTSSVQQFLGAASPAAMQTFTGSLQLLNAEIGQQFIPYLAEAVRWIQDAAEWVRDLDQATKSNIATATVWVAGLSGGVLVLNQMWVVGSRVVAMIQLLGLGLARTAALAAAHPYILLAAALGAVVVAIAGMSGAFGSLGGLVGSAHDRIVELETLLEKLQGGGKLSRQDIKGAFTPEVQENLNQLRDKPEQLKAALEAMKASAEKTLAAHPEDRAGRASVAIRQAMLSPVDEDQGPMEQFRDRLTKIVKALREADPEHFGENWKRVREIVLDTNTKETGEERLKRIDAALRGPSTEARAQLEAIKNIQKNGLPGGKQYDVALPKEMAPQNLALEGVRAAFQRQALGQGPLEQRLLEQNRAAYAEFQKSLNRIGDNTDPNRKGGPIQ